MIVPTSNLFKLAYGKYAIGAYNINNMEQTLGLFKGSIESQSPFIIQLSKGARKYADKGMLEVIIRKAEEIFPEAVFAVHLDHGDEATCYDCIESGFYSSVMIDASHEPFDENVATTKRVVERAHAKGLSVEAELGRLGGVEEDVQVDEGSAFLTDPKEAVEFVVETGCDSLAAAIGTSHGPYKFKGKQSLHFEVIREIQKLLPGTPIVMHGSSSVPEEEVRRINEAGGKLDPSARGVDEEEYLPAAKLVLIPEVSFSLEGENGLLEALHRCILQKGNALIVVAEGAGQELFNDSIKDTDPSGNIRFKDIGVLLKSHIEKYFKERSLEVRFKYIDPSYMIRGVPANPHDSIYCAHLAQNAVHAAMAGKTGVAMGCWHGHYVHVPIGLAVAGRKQVDPKGDLWHSLIEATGQSPKFF